MYTSGIESPRGVWWKPAHKAEKVWVKLSFGWCMVLFAMMPLWHWKGGQNPAGERYKVAPGEFMKRTLEFVNAYQVKDDKGAPLFDKGNIPIVKPPAGSDIYLLGQMWRWSPVLHLEKGVEYTLHLSALDVNHGFSLFPLNLNFQVVPGYDYGLKIKANEAGDFRIICNEFCGIGHHNMVGRIVVTEGGQP